MCAGQNRRSAAVTGRTAPGDGRSVWYARCGPYVAATWRSRDEESNDESDDGRSAARTGRDWTGGTGARAHRGVADVCVRAGVGTRSRACRAECGQPLTITADSDGYYRSSLIELEGDTSERTFFVEFKRVPAGQYQLSAVVRNGSGRTWRSRPRASASSLLRSNTRP